MATLSERAEAAQTLPEAIEVFEAYFFSHGDKTPLDFRYWLDLARKNAPIGDALKPRALGYLLLAAMACVPKGWAVTLETWGGQPADVTLKETRWEPFGQDRRMAWIYSHKCGMWKAEAPIPACALLSEIIKAGEA